MCYASHSNVPTTETSNKNGFKKQENEKNYGELQVVHSGNLSSFLNDYRDVFLLKTSCVVSKAHDYLQGLFQSERNKRNVERMAEQTQAVYQNQQHFLSDSPWSATALMNKVALDINELLGDKASQALSIDESSHGKSGKHSVGASHQYNGNKGKLDNCQTGVYASLSRNNRVGLISGKLFLPDEWVNDIGRCIQAGIPKQAIIKKTKIELALEIVHQAKAIGVEFGYINADGLYGSSYEFGRAIDSIGEKFVVDVHKDQMVYVDKPVFEVPVKKKSCGRKPTRLVATPKPVEVQAYIKTLRNPDFQEVNIRKGTKGWLKSKVHTVTVWVWDNQEDQPRERTLIIRKSMTSKDEVKYALSNFTKDSKTTQQFAFMQAQRFWIERAFEDIKGELGMSDYQVRKYNAWYHHQALTMLAMLFVNKQKTIHQDNIPLLSVRDIRLQIMALLKNQNLYLENEIDQMLTRHEKRRNDILRYYPDNDYF